MLRISGWISRRGIYVGFFGFVLFCFVLNLISGTSLAVQWLRVHLPNAGGTGSIPGQGAKIPHASGPKNQNIKQKQYYNKFNKDFKNGPHQKKKLKKKN